MKPDKARTKKCKKGQGRKPGSAGRIKGGTHSLEILYGKTPDKQGEIDDMPGMWVERVFQKFVLKEELQKDDIKRITEFLASDDAEETESFLCRLGREVAIRIIQRDGGFFDGFASVFRWNYDEDGNWKAVNPLKVGLLHIKNCLQADVSEHAGLSKEAREFARAFQNKYPSSKLTYEEIRAEIPAAKNLDERTIREAAKELGLIIKPKPPGRPKRIAVRDSKSIG